MAERIFGVETEYAITGMLGKDSTNRAELVKQVIDLAHKRFVHLPDLHHSGMFLENGARFYIDCGLHPEITTPECANPWDVVRYQHAGDRMLAGLARELQSSSQPGTEVMCFRSNVDYSGTRSTWGCHESYLHRMDPALLPSQVIPHLVSRVIYTGAGGFNPLSKTLEFTLSPRAAYVEQVISKESTHSRGIFHTKNESLSRDGYNRLHILCGESLCSEIAAFLKIGATALVVAMADAGLKPGDNVRLAAPLDALRAVARDVTCRTPLQLTDGRTLTALEIQHHYLALAAAHSDHPFMPPWTGEICRRWRNILELLEGAPRSVVRTLDWAIKIPLYAERALKRGVAWERFAFFGEVFARLNTALAKRETTDQTVTLELVLGPRTPIPEEVASLGRLLHSRGTGWEEFKQFLDMRPEFREIDTRFSQLGEKGIFHTLDSTGVLDHRVDGVNNIEHAMTNPPAIGRARIRGAVIRRLAGNNGFYGCDWQSIVDHYGRQMLDLSDPFASEEHWRAMPEENSTGEPPPDLFSLDRTIVERYLSRLRRRT